MRLFELCVQKGRWRSKLHGTIPGSSVGKRFSSRRQVRRGAERLAADGRGDNGIAQNSGGNRGVGLVNGNVSRELFIVVIVVLLISGPGIDIAELVKHQAERAVIGVDGQGVSENGKRVQRQGREDVKESLSGSSKVQKELVLLAGNGEGVSGKENVEQANANRPDICLFGVIVLNVVVKELWCHVSLGADAKLSVLAIGGGQTPIGKTDRAVVGDKNVFRLDVSVVDALGVGVLDGLNELEHELQNVHGALACTNGFVEVAFWVVLHDEEGRVLVLKVVEEGSNVLMLAEDGVYVYFFLRLVNGRVLLLVDALERDERVLVPGILCEGDDAKGAVVEDGDDLVAVCDDLLGSKSSHGDDDMMGL